MRRLAEEVCGGAESGEARAVSCRGAGGSGVLLGPV